MYLKSLRLQGFKSFADKTDFEFHEGVTSIVGPNGCGKSNIVDSIRWVLGETSAKALRGGEMADVIFGGTDKRKAHGMAEVNLILGDCEKTLNVDYNEVSIGRRVFKDGHSEYLLNNKACRLKDIHELLMDTGIGRTSYSIMEQGKIDMLLSSKPEDRRAVFEEAAGITKFKTQKKEALRKLDYTEANLLRLADIIAEIKRQMGSLQRQSAKARRYQNLLVDLRTLHSHLSKKRYDERLAEKAELQGSITSLRNRHSKLEQSVEGKEHKIAEVRDAYQHLEAQIADTRQDAINIQNEVQTALNRIGFNEERAAELNSLMEQNSRDIDETSSKLSQQELDLRSTEETLTTVETTVQTHREQLEETGTRHREYQEQLRILQTELTRIQESSNRAESEIVTSRAQTQNLLSQSETDRQRRDQLEEELVKLRTDRDEKQAERERLQADVREHHKTIETQEEELIVADKASVTAARELEALQSVLRDQHRSLAEKESRLFVLEEFVAHGEGFQEGTQAVIKGLNHPEHFQPQVRGVLASFIEADEEYAAAMEAALGRHLQTILISDASFAEQIIETLTQEKLGEASLIAEDFLNASSPIAVQARPQGAVAWALEKVRIAESARPLVQQLLANVLIVPNLRTAVTLRPQVRPEVTFVTMRGELVSPQGIMQGGTGSEDKGSVLHRQNEIQQLRSETGEFRSGVESKEQEEASLAEALRNHATNLEVVRERLQRSRVTHSTVEGQCALVEREIQQSDGKIESQEWEQREVEKRLETNEQSVTELRTRIDAMTSSLDTLRSRGLEIQQTLEETRLAEQETSTRVSELRTALAVEERTFENLREQRLPMADRVRELEELLARRRGEIETFRGRIDDGTRENETLNTSIEEKKHGITAIEEKLRSLDEQRGHHAAVVEKSESELVELRREINKLNEKRGNEEIQTAQFDIRIENLSNIIQQRYNIQLETFEPDSHALLTAIESQRKACARSEKRRATMATQSNEEGGESELSGKIVDDIQEEETETALETILEPVPGESGPDWKFVKEVVADLKGHLDSMGAVNLDAIEEFDELEERYGFLQGQHDDLVKSKDELHLVIAKINRETRKMFAETFEKVRLNFRDIFSELFGKGSNSDLVLLDETDPLESSIDIVAKPPGKKLQSITLLSGGERSMTAVALLFAIYMVKPSPFCVLDELDAPLDEANIGRFLKVLERFVDDSQFIVITHNKRTMNRADVLYGVTMEEFGVSKRVGVKLTGKVSRGGDAVEKEIPMPDFEPTPYPTQST